VYESQLDYNADRVAQEMKRDKTLPPSLPLNDPLGIQDPSVPSGSAPRKEFVATKRQRMEDDSTSLGRPPTRAEARKWFYLGDFSSDEEEGGLEHL
jgi:hypothetical protein